MLKINLSRSMSFCFAIALALLVTGCGGGSSSSSTTTGTTTVAPNTLTLATSSSAISASSPATLTATLKNSAGTALPGIVVMFATAGTGHGTFYPTGGTALTDASGNAVISLNAGTAIGADSVTATATVAGTAVTSNVIGFNVSAAPITQTPAAITFVSATPSTIAIKGTGGQGNSTVVFTVRDTNGNALPGQLVNFALNTSVGNITLGSPTGTSAADGTVSANLQAGTTATVVRVTATLAANPAITTVSSQLVVSTAIPHQNGFSISASLLNIEALNFDGVTTSITARASDRYGNLVPDGTAISFRTEGGASSINPSCTTTAGACSVTLTSSGRRPSDGRLTVLAFAIGEESFTDLNGNGVYDLGEPFTDLPEAFIDGNENGVRGPNTTEPGSPLEEFIDFNLDGAYSPGDGYFNGVLRACDLAATTAVPIPAGCPSVNGKPPATTVNVRSSVVIVFSGSVAVVSGLPATIALASCPSTAPSTYNVTVGDVNGNSLAKGTTIALSTTNGTITSPTSYVIGDTNVFAPFNFQLSMVTDATSSAGTCTNPTTTGTLTIVVTTPTSKTVTTRTFAVTD